MSRYKIRLVDDGLERFGSFEGTWGEVLSWANRLLHTPILTPDCRVAHMVDDDACLAYRPEDNPPWPAGIWEMGDVQQDGTPIIATGDCLAIIEKVEG